MNEEKAIRRSDRKAFRALLQRVTDIFNGACGTGLDWVRWQDEWATTEQIGRVMAAVQDTFDFQIVSSGITKLSYHHIVHFEQPLVASLWLFEQGVRVR